MFAFIGELIAAVWEFLRQNNLFIFLYLDKRNILITYQASSKSRNEFFNGSVEFYQTQYYEGPPPHNENMSEINFTSLVRIIKYIKYEEFCLGGQNYCDF